MTIGTRSIQTWCLMNTINPGWRLVVFGVASNYVGWNRQQASFLLKIKICTPWQVGHERQVYPVQLKLRTLLGKMVTTISSFLSTSVAVERTAPTTFVSAVRGVSPAHT